MGAVRGDHSDDHHCMLLSEANVMVTPWKKGMKVGHTMCVLVGDNRTEGLVVASGGQGGQTINSHVNLIRVAHHRATWRMMGEHDCFQMKDGYGVPVTVMKDEDMLYVGKTTCRGLGMTYTTPHYTPLE